MSILFENARQRDTAPFRFDVVGSFLRPQEIQNARAQFEQGKITQAELTAVEDAEIIKLVEKQKAAGLRAVTDGELRRSWWHLDFMWGFDGIERTPIDKGYQFHGEVTRGETAQLSGKIAFGNHPFVEHFKFLKKVAGDTVVCRQTIPAPAQLLAELQRAENRESTLRLYPDAAQLEADIAQAYRQAILALYEAGCRNVQLDDCTWGMFCDTEALKLIGITPQQFEAVAERYIRLNNLAIADLPQDLVITTHVCRGNYHSTYASSGGYEPVAPFLFAKENVDAFYLEFDDERSGDFVPLRFVPKDKQVVLGLFCSKTGELEDKELILKRIKEATQYLDINQICLSPQCGFASTEEGNILTEEQQWNKLRFIKEIADEIWN